MKYYYYHSVFIPESARWLLSKGRVEGAEMVLGRIVCFRDGQPVPVEREKSESFFVCIFWDLKSRFALEALFFNALLRSKYDRKIFIDFQISSLNEPDLTESISLWYTFMYTQATRVWRDVMMRRFTLTSTCFEDVMFFVTPSV